MNSLVKVIDDPIYFRLKKPDIIFPKQHINFKDNVLYYPTTTCGGYKDLDLCIKTNYGPSEWGPQVSIFHHNKILKDLSLEWNKPIDQNWAIKEKKRLEPEEILETSIVLASTGGHNFYHFIVDLIPRIRLLKKLDKNIFNKNYKIITHNLDFKYQKQYFDILGIKNEDCIFFPNLKYAKGFPDPDKKFYKIKNAILPSASNSIGIAYPKIISFLNEHVKILKNFSKGEKIFLNRKGGTTRDLKNANDIEAFLISKGFSSINPSDYSIQEQASIFYNAKIIVSAHSSALTNIIFCKQDATVIELFSPAFVMPSFHLISNFKKMNYIPIIGNGEDWRNEPSSSSNLTANPTTEVKNIQEIFNKISL